MRNNLITILIPALLFASFSLMSAQSNEEWGLASYYSDDFEGKTTAYGVEYDKNQLTAAHKLHPFGTMLKVTRLDNNKSVTVKVIDKGPYIKGRVVDVSRAAAERIGLVAVGVAEVKVEVVGRSKAKPATVQNNKQPERSDIPTSFENTAPRRKEVASTSTKSQADTPKPKKAATSTSKKSSSTASTSSSSSSSSSSSKKAASSSKKTTTKAKGVATAQLVGKEFKKYGLYKISIQKPEAGNWGVQVVSLSNYENVFTEVTNLQETGFKNILIHIEEGTISPVYKIILGPFESEASAENYRKNLLKRYKIKGFVKELNKTE